MNKRRIATLVAALVVVLAVLGGVLFLRPSTGTNVVVAENSPTPSASPTATPSLDPTPYPIVPAGPVQCDPWSSTPMNIVEVEAKAQTIYDYATQRAAAVFYNKDHYDASTNPYKWLTTPQEYASSGWFQNPGGVSSMTTAVFRFTRGAPNPGETGLQMYHRKAVALRLDYFNTQFAVTYYTPAVCGIDEVIARTPS